MEHILEKALHDEAKVKRLEENIEALINQLATLDDDLTVSKSDIQLYLMKLLENSDPANCQILRTYRIHNSYL